MKSDKILLILVCCALLLIGPVRAQYDASPGGCCFDSQDFKMDLKVGEILSRTGDSGLWSKDFSIPGITGTVHVTASDGSNLYIGGNFKTAGSILANSIVKWNGQNWSSIGEGPENGITHRDEYDVPSVESITYYDGKLFLGGQFRKAGTREVNGIAYWDGDTWNEMGNDSLDGVRRKIFIGTDTIILSGFVYALFAHNNKIYAGGDFQIAGETESNGVAAWNLETGEWESLGGGLASTTEPGLVYAYSFAARGDTLYVGGKFNRAGGVPVQNLAKWDGTQWHAMGEAEGYIYDLQFDNEENLYAIGFFNANDTTGECGLGKWDGTAWTSVQGPLGFNSSVSAIQFINNELYAGGSFVNLFDTPAALAKWDGNNWDLITGLGQSSNEFFLGNVSDLELVNDKLYVTGNFTKASDLFVVNAVEWDYVNSSWKKLDDGSPDKGIHDGEIRAMAISGNAIYAGGNFTVAGGVYARNIAKWNGNDWESLGTGFENGIRGSVYTIFVDGNDVYVGGYFGSAGSSEAYHIAKWDGTAWSPIGIGVGGIAGAHVRGIVRQGDYLYVAGYFAVVGDEENFELPANSIARFNLLTNRWEALGRGIEHVFGIPGRVYDMELFEDKILIGGEFLNADEMFFQNFAVLTDNKFTGLGDTEDIGVEGAVYTVKGINGEILIGGVLQLEPGGVHKGILKWEGENWAELNAGLTVDEGSVFLYDIESFHDGFIAGGYFKYAGDKEVNNVAYFDGNEWIDLGGGVQPGAVKLAATGNKIFVSGPTIIYTGEDFGVGITQFNYDSDINSGLIDQKGPDSGFSLRNYPNPFYNHTTIEYNILSPGTVRVAVFDISGREVWKLLQEHKQAGTYSMDFDAVDLPGGIYLCRIFQDASSETKKMILFR